MRRLIVDMARRSVLASGETGFTVRGVLPIAADRAINDAHGCHGLAHNMLLIAGAVAHDKQALTVSTQTK